MATRREVLVAAGWAALAGSLGACSARGPGGGAPDPEPAPGREPEDAAALSATPPEEPPAELLATAPEPGTRPLGLVPTGDPLLHVPPDLAAGERLPLVVTLHGAGGDAEGGLALLRGLADEHGLVLLAPASRGGTRDAVGGSYGPDVELIDRSLREVFTQLPIDPGRISVAGFSDGASYALGLGLANGDLFSSILAFSPGFVPRAGRSGTPAVFVSHGTDDEVLPIERTSRDIVPALEDDGYDVTYREFDGPHTLPPEVAREAVEWLGRG